MKKIPAIALFSIISLVAKPKQYPIELIKDFSQIETVQTDDSNLQKFFNYQGKLLFINELPARSSNSELIRSLYSP